MYANIDDDLIASAIEYSGVKERSSLVRMALEEFVQKRAELRLAKLKGSMPDFGRHLRDGGGRYPSDPRRYVDLG